MRPLSVVHCQLTLFAARRKAPSAWRLVNSRLKTINGSVLEPFTNHRLLDFVLCSMRYALCSMRYADFTMAGVIRGSR